MKLYILVLCSTLLTSVAMADLDFGSDEKCSYIAKRYAVEAFEEEIETSVQLLGGFLNITTTSVYPGPGKEPTEFYVQISNLMDGGESAFQQGLTTIPDVDVQYHIIFSLDYSTGTGYPKDICKPISVQKVNSSMILDS